MNNYLMGSEFNLYQGGVYNAMYKFTEKGVEVSLVDRKTRIQFKKNQLKNVSHFQTLISVQEIFNEIESYVNCKWDSDKIILKSDKKYNRYLTFTGDVEGKEVTSQLWARRQLSQGEDMRPEQNIDILTVEGEIIGFVATGRLTMDILIKKGYESVSPLSKYEDPLYSKAKYGIDYLGNQFVTTRDGINLATDVYLPYPLKKGQRVPAIVIRTCYGKTGDIDRSSHWVNRGYALVIQDVRGREDSDGDLIVFSHERDDASDLFDWIVEQEWCDGNIGMWGASYLGYTTTAAATSGNPHLKTAISEVNVGSPFYDTARRGGTICSWPLLSWSLAQSVSNRISFEIFAGISVNPDAVCRMRPIKDIPTLALGIESKLWNRWSDHYYYDGYWKFSDNTVHSKNIKIPMLIMSGWYDGDALGVQETWRFLEKHDVPGRRIVLGAWPHGLNAFRDCRDLEFGDNAIDYDFDTRIVRWFDRYLKGIENGEDKKPRATYYVVGENQWRTSESWNPKESTLTNFYLSSGGKANSMHGDGMVLAEPKNETGYDEYVYDPENPITTEEEGDGTVPYHCNHFQVRQDVLCYDTDILTEDLVVAGNFYSEFYASSSAVDTDFTVRVSDVDEKGIARKISDNVIRSEFRKGWENPELLEPHKVEKYEMEMYFNGYVFKKGHRVRIDITSSNYMEFFPNTNTGINPYDDPRPIKATQRIYHGKEYPSHVKIPVLSGSI